MDFNGFDLSTISNAFYGSTQVNSIWLGSTKIWPSGPHDYSRDYLTIKSTSDNNTIVWKGSNANFKTISVSTNNGVTWTQYTSSTSGTTLAILNTGDKLLIKGNNTAYSYSSTNGQNWFTSTGSFDVEGNIMSLIYEDNFINQTTIYDPYTFVSLFYGCTIISAKNLILPATTITEFCYYEMFRNCTSLITTPTLPATRLYPSCYEGMFQGCTSLTTAPALPATRLYSFCYGEMFSGCTSLITAPALPATTLANNCYQYMFKDCTSLTTAPTILPATTLANNCCWNMFRNCTSLTTAPALSATTLADYCYAEMFEGCTSLTTAPALPATTLASRCYSEMFSGCTSLTTAPALPATNLADYCYQIMFGGCTSLTTAPALPATTLASHCYDSMFAYCDLLTTAPTLPATTLADYCYYNMFGNCTSLTTAPELPATTLSDCCYQFMFYGCTSLNYVKCLATNISAVYPTLDWLNNVAATGTFVKNSTMTSWTTGVDGIPSGWQVEDYVDYSQEYFTIKSTSNNNQIYFCTNDTSFINTIQISTNKYDWFSKTPGAYTKNISLGTLNNGGKLYIKATNSRYATGSYVYHYFTFTGNFEVEGNIMSLVYGDNFIGQTVLSDSYNFCRLFYNNTYLTNAENLVLPATTLTNYCYYKMFQGCTALTKSPESLPATNLPTSCYEEMFSGCTSLTTAPEIMATSTALSLRNMFLNCRALTTVPDLHLTTLANQCCQQMFANCLALTKAPALPATTLANFCYQQMFSGCIALTTAPELPATTLASSCYSSMFTSCASLTTAPELPAPILTDNCYKSMFNGCTSLNYIKCLATDISATTPTSNWLNNVSATGTFVKDANMTSWTTGVDGIPTNWTIQNA